MLTWEDTKQRTAGSWILVAASASILYVALQQLPSFGDWNNIFYPAAKLANPYQQPGFLNPPWAAAIIYPFSLLSQHAGGALWMLVSIGLILLPARRLGADRLGLALILGNPFMWFFLTLGQLDALILLGFVLAEPPWDVLLLAVKPQVIGTAILFRLREYDRRAWLLLAAALLLSFLLWWDWPTKMIARWLQPGQLYYLISHGVWPWGIPFGLILFGISWKRESLIPGALATYFLTPYVGPGSIIVYATLIFSTAPLLARLLFFFALWLIAFAIYG
jgi:hypothetical protein